MLEKLFEVRLNDFVRKNKILNESQYGFRTGRSTLLAILDLIEYITDEIDKRKSMSWCIYRSEKTFDTIYHAILKKKLHHYGIRSIILEWIGSYPNDREQYVQMGDTISNNRNIDCGNPQGSILGPKLFILYINDICNI